MKKKIYYRGKIMWKKIKKLMQKYEEIITYLIVGVLTTIVSLVIYYGLVLTMLSNYNWQILYLGLAPLLLPMLLIVSLSLKAKVKISKKKLFLLFHLEY